MIKLYQFTPAWGIPNASPFCMKLETYLRMANIPYEAKSANNPRKSPKGKIPYIDLDGECIGDSDIIIRRLKKDHGDTVDGHLTPEQLATSLAYHRLCEEHLYWTIVYSRWIDDNGWAVLKPLFFKPMKGLKAVIIPHLLRKHVKKELFFQGLGRHTQDELYDMGLNDLKTIATHMNGKQFFFGDKPASVDACVYSHLASIWYAPIPTPMKDYLGEHRELIDYCERMLRLYFPELGV